MMMGKKRDYCLSQRYTVAHITLKSILSCFDVAKSSIVKTIIRQGLNLPTYQCRDINTAIKKVTIQLYFNSHA